VAERGQSARRLQYSRDVQLRAALVLGFVSVGSAADARPFRVEQIPNGDVLQCNACHAEPLPLRNSFGQQVEVHLDGRDVDWPKLFNLDADGDGYSNGQELGDSCGLWARGRTPERTTGQTNPGDSAATPAGPMGPTCTCGNGRVDPGEECDDGNHVHADRCTNYCEMTTCGDGRPDSGEPCDDGNDDNTDACTTTCVPARCGDGFVQAGVEACDDGNRNDSDGCRNTCVEAFCGDGAVWAGMETCDDGNTDDMDGCSNNCVLTSCGNGTVDPHETCDEGAANSDTVPGACRLTCVPPSCGDAVIDPGEQCDPGMSGSTSCRMDCRIATCGDGHLDLFEACDAGGDNSDSEPDACRLRCRLPSCGDGVVDKEEVCDLGAGAVDCSSECPPAPPPTVEPSSCTCAGSKGSAGLGFVVLGALLLLPRRERGLKARA